MKKIAFLTTLVVCFTLCWNACTPAEENGTLQLGLEFSGDNDLKSAMQEVELASALITIRGMNGEIVYEKEPLTLYRFGNSYTTNSLRLPVGVYRLTEFMLSDAGGNIAWATPLEGSPLAHLVRRPLPLEFEIGHEQTTTLDIQVIRVRDHSPSDFGYINFDIGFVERFCLKIFYEYECQEWGWDDRLDSTGMVYPILQPRLTIHSEGRMVLNEPLNAGLNRFMVPVPSEFMIPMPNEGYLLRATDCRGNLIFEQRFRLAGLLEHRCGEEYPPLVISHKSDSNIIITPEGLYEPDIAQGVFGSITLPVDDTTSPEGQDVWPVIRDIYFYPYAVLDSIIPFAPMNCYIDPGIVPAEPLVIVRSNSDGFFQVPMEPGVYLYMVREEDKFYIDAWISSHLPGQVTVYPDEVTKLMIHIIDCSMWY